MKENITTIHARKNFGRPLGKTTLPGKFYALGCAGRPMAVPVFVDCLLEKQQINFCCS